MSNETQKSSGDWPTVIFLFVVLPVAFTWGGMWAGIIVLVVGVVALGWSRRHQGPFPTRKSEPFGTPRSSAAETQANWFLMRADLDEKDRQLLTEFEKEISELSLPREITLTQLQKRHSDDPELQDRIALLEAHEFISATDDTRSAWAISDNYGPWMPGPPHEHIYRGD